MSGLIEYAILAVAVCAFVGVLLVLAIVAAARAFRPGRPPASAPVAYAPAPAPLDPATLLVDASLAYTAQREREMRVNTIRTGLDALVKLTSPAPAETSVPKV